MSRLVEDLLHARPRRRDRRRTPQRELIDVAELLDDAVERRAGRVPRPADLDVDASRRCRRSSATATSCCGSSATWSPTPPCTPTPAARSRSARVADGGGVVDPGRRRRPGPAAGGGRARLRAVLARRQGPHPRPRRQRAGAVDRRLDRARARRHGALRQLGRGAAARSPSGCPPRADRPVAAFGTIERHGRPRDPSELDPAVAARLKRDAAGLVAAVVQQHDTGEVLMVGWMDDEALHRTLTTGRATYWSRSRQEYWVKGETSGHAQHVKSVALDCDGDAAAGQGRPGRRGLPHRRPHLLRRGRAA